MSDEKTASSLEAAEGPAVLGRPGDPQDGGRLTNYTRKDEARVVRKLDWNLMTIFFVLCELQWIQLRVDTHVFHMVDGSTTLLTADALSLMPRHAGLPGPRQYRKCQDCGHGQGA